MSSLESAQFRAVAGDTQGFGATPNEALDALVTMFPDFGMPIIILPFNRGDVFFTQAQHDRLQELKASRTARTADETRELDHLIEAEFEASVARMQSVQRVKM